MVLAAVGVDALRVGFFADDFHFLDVALRVPLATLVTGAHGMWPWYRPLSRELFFKGIATVGPDGLVAAHAVSLLTLLGILWLVWRIGRRLLGPSAAAIAIALVVTFDHTKFLTAWASGLQDLLSTFLILLAVDAHQAGRHRLALLGVVLAPMAKETGFVALPLLIASDVVLLRRVGRVPQLLRYASGAVLSLCIHVAARLSWGAATGTLRNVIEPERLTAVLSGAARGFILRAPETAPGAEALVLASIAALLSFALVALARSFEREAPEAPNQTIHRRGILFATVAALFGVVPVVVGHLLTLTFAHSYHLFPAIPWIALLLARGIQQLPSLVWRSALPILVAWNVWASGFVALDMDRSENWGFQRWDWGQTLRFTAQTQRLSEDVRRSLAARPESLVVLYDGRPGGAYFQTEDGPATRVILGDPTVRTFGLNEPPADIREDRLSILTFDTDRLHLRPVDWTHSETLLRAMKAVTAGRGDVALALLAFNASSDPAPFDRAYVRSAALLLTGGSTRYIAGLEEAGLGDTTRALPSRLSAPLAQRDRGLAAVMERMTRSPTSASTHAALAESLLAREALPAAGVEFRIASTLDAGRLADRYRLALVMLGLGGTREAVAELQALVDMPTSGAVRPAARALLDRVRSESRLTP